MKIVVEGPPQGGKTTVASVVKERYGLCYVSTSEAVRNAVHLGNSAHSSTLKQLIDSDELIPDSVLVKVVSEATQRPDCINGFVLDGFPRTRKQSKLMQESEDVKVDVVVELDVPDNVLQSRFGGRWFHPRSGRAYHNVYNPPLVDGKDDDTGEPLEQRAEDKPEMIMQRMFQYRRQLSELRTTFSNEAWTTVEASGSVEAVRNNVFAVLDSLYYAQNSKKAKSIHRGSASSWWRFW
ncbi:putative mitochondrial adenylate kinase b [Leptomonas pyrrhocoris]|uniref:Putative mitochondrial adenylate kinase b n=1 Tax=Leptomonas pyrrhocoris TaxID=157538 RepID=A0A0M9G415_LEPPY|nr:putative mitochondrial adenylate kinase b [Leptomonas pyrrhocoris]XP_015660430.1 putative mitochondrial adenylate kinase b [Leptomonas pyrrhocoris]KPA81990.1 putative mitochondrial adenylate kinase b [Leptomonas pyrrhocoris]KPA81991.1 putative mitochondrial adenylate kinase b [Leptomonas pyrrhocoris]|eukprot:XP_015660429.1 putative mitochondrial adenylate kinase b [Leptomonas pyrrhocoris]